jgi:hypothetical protein
MAPTPQLAGLCHKQRVVGVGITIESKKCVCIIYNEEKNAGYDLIGRINNLFLEQRNRQSETTQALYEGIAKFPPFCNSAPSERLADDGHA